MDLTRIKETGIKISSAEMVEILYKEQKNDILLIKLFDRLHNMQTIGAKSPEKIKKIVDETMKEFYVLSIFFNLSRVEMELVILAITNLNIKDFLDLSLWYEFSYCEDFTLPLPKFSK